MSFKKEFDEMIRKLAPKKGGRDIFKYRCSFFYEDLWQQMSGLASMTLNDCLSSGRIIELELATIFLYNPLKH